MREYLTLGPAPCDEPCAQVGEEDFEEKCCAEADRYLKLLRKMFGDAPEGAKLGTKWFPHDFGKYLECVVYYDSNNEAAVDYAFKVENNLPATWEG